MPAYDYKCNSCGHRFEERQSFYADPVASCPECESEASRQFVAVPIVFKGSGFYVNDTTARVAATPAPSRTPTAHLPTPVRVRSPHLNRAEKAKSSTSGSDE